MSVSDQEHAQGALRREWLIARVVIIGGFVVAIAAMVWFGWLHPMMQRREAITNRQHQAQALEHAAIQMCVSGLNSAKNFGIVPQYGKLATSNIYTTNVQGRYVCVAATPATRYLVAVDLLCRNLKDRRCVSLFSVRQADGTVLYQRQS